MNRKEFFARVGLGAAAILVPACIAGLASSCQSEEPPSVAPSNIAFNVDVSFGSLATNGGCI